MVRFLVVLLFIPLVSACVTVSNFPPTSSSVYSGPKSSAIAKTSKEQSIVEKIDLQPVIRSNEEQLALLNKTFSQLKEKNAELCKKLLFHTNLKDCDWLHLKGHDLPTVNSFPWNDLYINVTSRLLSYVKNEDEMAYVLAHEMGHQLAEHVTENLPQVTTFFNYKFHWGYLPICGVCALQTGTEDYWETVKAQNALLAEITDNHFSALQEKEADYIATYLMANAGYKLAGATSFLKRMKELSPRTGKNLKSEAGYFDTHHFSENRFNFLYLNVKEIALKRENNTPLFPRAD